MLNEVNLGDLRVCLHPSTATLGFGFAFLGRIFITPSKFSWKVHVINYMSKLQYFVPRDWGRPLWLPYQAHHGDE